MISTNAASADTAWRDRLATKNYSSERARRRLSARSCGNRGSRILPMARLGAARSSDVDTDSSPIRVSSSRSREQQSAVVDSTRSRNAPAPTERISTAAKSASRRATDERVHRRRLREEAAKREDTRPPPPLIQRAAKAKIPSQRQCERERAYVVQVAALADTSRGSNCRSRWRAPA